MKPVLENEDIKPTGESAESGRQDWRVLRRLDAEVAERVMIWTRFAEQMHPTDNRTIDGVLYCPPDYPYNSGGAINVVPDYSTDIKAAMEVVEKLRSGAEIIQMNAIDGEWRVYILKRGRSCEFGYAATLPEAICRAALSLVDETTK